MSIPAKYSRLVYGLALLLVCVFPYAKLLKFPYNIPLLALICMVFFAWLEKGMSGMGFRKPGPGRVFIVRVLTGFLTLEMVFDLIIQPAIGYIFNEPADYSIYNFLEGNNRKYFLYLFYSWISAALAEEIIYRGFLLPAGEKLFRRTWIAVVVSSVIFSSAHLYQGWSGVALTFLFGIAFSLLYLRCGRNIWINIIVHGMVDSFFLTMAHTGNLTYYEKPFEFIKKLLSIH